MQTLYNVYYNVNHLCYGGTVIYRNTVIKALDFPKREAESKEETNL